MQALETAQPVPPRAGTPGRYPLIRAHERGMCTAVVVRLIAISTRVRPRALVKA
jgi:hypothetical protein